MRAFLIVDRYMKTLFTIGFIAVLLSWLLPNHYQPWLGAYQNLLAFTAIVLSCIWTLVKLPSITATLRQSLFLIFLLAIIFLQFAFEVFFYFGELLVFSLYTLAFFIALSVSQSMYLQKKMYKGFCKALAAVFLLAAILSTWIALKQWLMLSGSIWIADLPPNGRPFANLGQPNSLATLLGIGLASTLYFYEKNILQRLSASVLALFLIFGIALTQSRTPWLAGLAVCVFWAWKHYYPSALLKIRSTHTGSSPVALVRLSAKFVFLWYGIFLLLTLVLPLINEVIGLQSVGVSERAQQMQRLDLYKQFALAIYHGPWYGYGIGNVAAAQLATATIYPMKEFTFYTHNILLDILVWFGPIIGSAIIIVVSVWLWRLGVAAKSKESLFALVAAGFILTHSMLEYPHAYAFFFLPLGLLLGVAQNEITDNRRMIIPKPIALGLMGAIAVVGSWVMYEYVIIENDFRLMRFESAGVGKLRAAQAAPDVILLTQLREYTRLARTEPYVGMSDEKLAWMKQVTHQYPYSASLTRYVQSLALNNKPDEALEYLYILKAMHGLRYYQSVLYWLESVQDNHQTIKKILARLNENN